MVLFYPFSITFLSNFRKKGIFRPFLGRNRVKKGTERDEGSHEGKRSKSRRALARRVGSNPTFSAKSAGWANAHPAFFDMWRDSKRTTVQSTGIKLPGRVDQPEGVSAHRVRRANPSLRQRLIVRPKASAFGGFCRLLSKL